MKRYVVKIGGHALDSLAPDTDVLVALARDVVFLRARSSQVVIVHGGGPQISSLLERVGIVSEFHEGLRVTDEASMEYVAMALSQVNVHLVAALNRAGLVSVGLTGVDGAMIRARALGAPWGRAGTSLLVDTALLEPLWLSGVTPVMSPIGVDETGRLLNCNADTVAGALASALNADALVLLSDVDQLRSDPLDEASALSSVRAGDVRRLVNEGVARDGMRPKMAAALDALSGGARRVVMANGSRPHALRDVLDGTVAATEVLA